METIVGSISLQNQLVDMSDWDFSDAAVMKESMETIKERKARAIILSTAIGDSKFRSQCASQDPYRIVRQPISHVLKTIKCAKEQDNRGLCFVLEEIIGGYNEGEEAMSNMINQEGIMVSNPYSIMYREGAFGWVVSKAKVVTSSKAVRDNVDNTIAGRHWMKSSDNKWMVYVVEKGVRQESEMTIMGVDSEAFVHEELEARRYWGDLSGKELDPKLVNSRLSCHSVDPATGRRCNGPKVGAASSKCQLKGWP
jgi:hypothetical protein